MICLYSLYNEQCNIKCRIRNSALLLKLALKIHEQAFVHSPVGPKRIWGLGFRALTVESQNAPNMAMIVEFLGNTQQGSEE